MTYIRIKRLSFKTLFKVVYLGSLAPLATVVLISCLVAGLASLAGYEGSVVMDGKPVIGVNGFMTAALVAAIGLVMLPLLILPWVVVLWAYFAFGLWIYSKFRPLTLAYEPLPSTENDALGAASLGALEEGAEV
jgi:hypothetical protein